MDFIARATMTRLQQVYSIQARTLCVDWAASAGSALWCIMVTGRSAVGFFHSEGPAGEEG